MLKIFKKSLALLLGLMFILGTAFPSFAGSGGAGMVWIRSPYKGHDDYYLPFPSLQIESKYFFIKELKLGSYLQYLRRYRYGTVGAKIYMDVLGNADGFGVDAFYKLPIFINEFTLTPGVGLTYLSGDRTDYYYGISRAEAVRSGLKYYHADFSISPYVSLEASCLTENGWSIFANMQYTWLSDEITDSPMIGEDQGLMLSFGAMMSF